MHHARIEERSLALHRAVAKRLLNEPKHLRKLKENFKRIARQSKATCVYVKGWREILELPLKDICRLLSEDSARMRELRQSSPCSGILSPQERWKIYESFST